MRSDKSRIALVLEIWNYCGYKRGLNLCFEIGIVLCDKHHQTTLMYIKTNKRTIEMKYNRYHNNPNLGPSKSPFQQCQFREKLFPDTSGRSANPSSASIAQKLVDVQASLSSPTAICSS